MIQLNIQYEKEQLTDEIASILIEQKLVLTMTEIKQVNVISMKQNALIKTPYFLLTGVTKSLLFNSICDQLEHLTRNNQIKIYALPLVQMEHGDMDQLTKSLKPV